MWRAPEELIQQPKPGLPEQPPCQGRLGQDLELPAFDADAELRDASPPPVSEALSSSWQTAVEDTEEWAEECRLQWRTRALKDSQSASTSTVALEETWQRIAEAALSAAAKAHVLEPSTIHD
ncbi:unnamed protein product [Polarella glacialis]|uniref:Uncharacterized protein n=1 Tax=Polarella glacialis TaxID=89957 RepID=A0A813FAW1_POLGL|nr:unnamed protein product [Polarella glacialis]